MLSIDKAEGCWATPRSTLGVTMPELFPTARIRVAPAPLTRIVAGVLGLGTALLVVALGGLPARADTAQVWSRWGESSPPVSSRG